MSGSLPESVLALPAADLAPRLIGCTLVRTLDTGERLAGVIVETEAYTGPEDLASHAAGGRRTARVASMWKAPGTVYVYFTYGMHFCMNISCFEEGHSASVLLRAIMPTEGIATMRLLRTGTRARKRPLRDQDLASGPGKLCQAMAVDRTLDGVDILNSPHLALFDRPAGEPEPPVVATARVGLGSEAVLGVWKHKELRFVWAGHPCRSR
jgi:DNA-3-methyladenine glycosylase